MDKIRVLFILPEACKDSSEASDIMLQAYESCKQNVVNVSWLEESKFASVDLSKTDFVVFQEFKGKQYESLKESRCVRILGPWCLLVCLMEGRPIPNFTWPIYNVAMAKCVISCSHVSKARKLEIKEKVQLMGGCYTDNLMSNNTHLVTESVKSQKYLQAAESGVKLMISKWIDVVWDASQKNNIHCNDVEFTKYRCLPFHNLTISSTGFDSVEKRTEVAQMVARNGGVFTASLAVARTDVLVVHGVNGILSKKYKAAKANPNIFCVSVDWITESIKKGYALPHSLYTIKKGTSTPTKENESDPNFSTISAIVDNNVTKYSTLEESVIPKKVQMSVLNFRMSPVKRKSMEEVEKIIDGLDIKKAKKSGQYLDGCNVYLAGFQYEQREKLSKILNLSGATRYDDISDRVTHVIVGDPTCPEVKLIKTKNYSLSLVSVYWLLNSMEQQHAADEEKYLIKLHDSDKEQFSSPLGRKGLTLLRSNKTLTSVDLETTGTANNPHEEAEDTLMQQYRTTSADDSDTLVRLMKADSKFNIHLEEPQDPKQTTENNSAQISRLLQLDKTNQNSNIFYAKKFVILNFEMDESHYLKEQIESVLGLVMPKTYKGIPDYVVAPMFIKTKIQTSALETVNNLWISESIQESADIPIAYYHRPFVISSDSTPLENCVVTISGYVSYERNFLKELITALGGISQEQFARVSCLEKKIKVSTHLISLEADGKKYAAALKWGVPVVTKEWLFECAKSGKLEPEENFLLGDSKAPKRSGTTVTDSGISKNTGVVSTSDDSEKKSTVTSHTFSNSRRLTPLNQLQPCDINTSEKTPLNRRLFKGVGETPDPCSQVTPINKLMEEVRKTNLLGTPQTPSVPKIWYDVDTPESPFGAFIRPHLSPKSKKEIMRYINSLPDFIPPPKEPQSTPLSEVKRRCWKKLLHESNSTFTSSDETKTSRSGQQQLKISDESDDDSSIGNLKSIVLSPDTNDTIATTETTSEATSSQSRALNAKLKQIEAMIKDYSENRRSSRGYESAAVTVQGTSTTSKDTQPLSVGWDYNEGAPQEQFKIFMFSGVENDQRPALVQKLEELGGHVSDLLMYDPRSTHLICTKPARNEKTLACMASGKWILHVSYIDKCVEAGKFLPEEEFEFGNPKAKENIKIVFDKETEFKNQAIHWWRQEVSRRGYGAFNDMRAIIVAQNRGPLVRVIEAGGGQVVDVLPPFDSDVHATHCLLEIRSVPDFDVYIPLAKQGIFCINTIYVSEYLYRTNADIKDAVLPHFIKYYS